jgi:hypothetical protein
MGIGNVPHTRERFGSAGCASGYHACVPTRLYIRIACSTQARAIGLVRAIFFLVTREFERIMGTSNVLRTWERLGSAGAHLPFMDSTVMN